MERLAPILVMAVWLCGVARAEGDFAVAQGTFLNVEVADLVVTAASQPVRVEFTLRLIGKDGFLPSSFDGVHRDGVVNGAAGIAGSLYHGGANSHFLYDPASTAVIDPALIPGYVADPDALTGLFALTGGQYAPAWDLARIVTGAGEAVTLDFTVGHAGTDATEYVGATFTPLLGGDANLDRRVDLSDFAILKNSFGAAATATWAQGDFDGDGDVDLSDFVILKNNFGASGEEPVASN